VREKLLYLISVSDVAVSINSNTDTSRAVFVSKTNLASIDQAGRSWPVSALKSAFAR
jgi:hypothetical protein